MSEHLSLKQPKVFKLALLTSLFERFSFYILAFVFVLYVKEVFFFTDTQAFTLFGVFTALAYIMPAMGGYLADHQIGIRRCIIIGLFLEGLGLLLLSIPNAHLFAVSLALIVLGVGFFKTAPTDLMARSYKKHDPRIDGGFTLFYMGMNIGGFFAPLAGGVIQKYFGWEATFFVGAVSIAISLVLYFLLRHTAKDFDAKAGMVKLATKKKIFLIIGIIVSGAICVFLVSHSVIADIFFFITTVLIFVYFGYEIYKSPRDEKFKIITCLVLIIMGLMFFVLYFQAFTSVNLFIDRVVDRNVFGFIIPTPAFLALDPLWIIILSPLLALLYKYIAKKRGADLAITTKFPLGLFIISLCFFCLVLSGFFADAAGKISSWWMVLVFFLFALGELLIAALGAAMITRIAPPRLYGIMMGAWFLIASGLAASLSGVTASIASIPDGVHDMATILHIYSSAFLKMGAIGIVATIFCFAVAPYLKRIAKLQG
jgi:proton-dependent oligopeptide transporter, POT family